MDLSISLGLLGWGVVIVGALAFGVAAQFVGQTRTGYEWLIDAVAVVAGALIASEFIVGWRGFEPVFEGLALIPALAGGLVLGVIVEVATRFSTGGRYMSAAA
jgi:uncharacterized membrane protein YeaQ/YmgE (transglycosylase-associated protein family)